MFSLHFSSLCVCALLFKVMALAMKAMKGRVVMKSAVLTTTDDDIVVQNGISSDSDSSSECETDKGDNAGYDKECPSILILALEHAIAACKTLEGESLNAKHWKVNPSKFFDCNHLGGKKTRQQTSHVGSRKLNMFAHCCQQKAQG